MKNEKFKRWRLSYYIISIICCQEANSMLHFPPMKIFLAVLFFILHYSFFIIPAAAAVRCEPVYGGGLTEFCVQTQTPIQSGPTPAPSGFPVFPAPLVTKTPATGPEILPLIGIISSGVVGWILRRKSSKS